MGLKMVFGKDDKMAVCRSWGVPRAGSGDQYNSWQSGKVRVCTSTKQRLTDLGENSQTKLSGYSRSSGVARVGCQGGLV